MPGMNNLSGKPVADIAHLSQSIADILTTPLGTRLERRTYGSLLPELIDHPDNNASQVRLFSAVASALLRWEPRFRLTRVGVQRDAERPGYALIELHGSYHEGRRPAPLSLQVSVTARNA
mgnify:CR=1 FL=1